MKVKLDERQILKIAIGLIVIGAIVYGLIALGEKTKPQYSVKTPNGNVYSFREDVRIANKTPVFPDEAALRERFLDNNLTNITILFVPGSDKINAYYSVWGIEIGFKLTQLYNSVGYVTGEANIYAEETETVDNITSEPANLKIILVPIDPNGENKVVVDENRVYLHAKSVKGMEYSVIKTILSVLGEWTLA